METASSQPVRAAYGTPGLLLFTAARSAAGAFFA